MLDTPSVRAHLHSYESSLRSMYSHQIMSIDKATQLEYTPLTITVLNLKIEFAMTAAHYKCRISGFHLLVQKQYICVLRMSIYTFVYHRSFNF